MRVINTHTGHFMDMDPRDTYIKYAILSHTWNREGEQTYGELLGIQQRYPMSPYLPPDSQALHVDPPEPDRCHDAYSSWCTHSQSGGPRSEVHSWRQVAQRSTGPVSIWDAPELSPKIREACRVARENGYRYLWIDSCCIDKTSSSELSESINSMYLWYSCADICYAFLPDVPASEDHKAKDSHFQNSRWFMRGWTLQELIAPAEVIFLAQDWAEIGSKESLAEPITEITNIDYNALLRIQPLYEFSVAQRLSWAAKRETTREEDMAYSLLGIFDINMPTLYGEGEGAFRRLQEEIMRRTPDQSLFAWTCSGLPNPRFQLHDPEFAHAQRDWPRFAFRALRKTASLLASSIRDFSNCAGIETLSHDEVLRRLHLPAHHTLPATDYEFTPYGIRVQLPVIHFSSSKYFPVECVRAYQSKDIPLSQWYLVILGCGHKYFPEHLLGRICSTQSSGSTIELIYGGSMHIFELEHWLGNPDFDLLPIPPAAILRLGPAHISLKTLYIPQPRRKESKKNPTIWKPHDTVKLVLPKKTQDGLAEGGYVVALYSPQDDPRTIHSITLTHKTHTITIEYRHSFEFSQMGQILTVEAHVKMSRAGLSHLATHDGEDDITTVSWTDSIPWDLLLQYHDVKLATTPGDTALTLRLGVRFATKNHYFLHIELLPQRMLPSLVARIRTLICM